jgi:hypothetical protein
VNAVTLFREADRQQLPAVGLTLCFSAIEAIVCDSAKLVTDQVTSRVPALLIHDSARRHDAKGLLNILYDVRSRLAHGEEVAASTKLYRIARTVAAGVIRSVCCWIAYCERCGTVKQEVKDFATELIICERKDQVMVGVPDLAELIPPKADVKRMLKLG